MKPIKSLVAGYFVLSVAALVAAVLLRNHPNLVNSTVWIRGTIVVATAVLLLAITARAARGSRSAFRRLRIIAIVVPIAVAVLIAIPGLLPLWFRLEQGLCGLLMLGVAILANRRELRGSFTRGRAG